MWVMDDHTGGPPVGQAEQADNDLAIGRIIDYISHSPVWSSSAIFISEDDAQDGVDHVDGHRSPGYVISPYTVQNSTSSDHTYYSQVNITRTIEQILGLPPMNQFDLVGSPMRTAFVTNPAQANLTPWSHVPNQVPLTMGVAENEALKKANIRKIAAHPRGVKALRQAWLQKKIEIFAGKLTKPDSEDPDTVNHLNWYMSTGFKRPYPGESKVRPPSDFDNRPAPKGDDDDN
jgi:hypothetical protein